MGQFKYGEKNYEIFQVTTDRVCEMMYQLVDLVQLQSALNHQDEKDKATFSLLGFDPAETKPAPPGSEEDAKGKGCMVSKQVYRDGEGSASGLKHKLAQGLQSLMKKKAVEADPTPQPGASSHVQIENHCSVCHCDKNQSHQVSKMLKFACLKYTSGQVHWMGDWYERFKLIKIHDEMAQLQRHKIAQIIEQKNKLECT